MKSFALFSCASIAVTCAALTGIAGAGDVQKRAFVPAVQDDTRTEAARLEVRVAKRRNGARERVIVRARRLAPRTVYALYMDDPSSPIDPSPIAVATATANRRGRLSLRLGTPRHPLPFGVTAEALSGGRIELRTEDARVVLAGVVPAADRSAAEEASADPVCVQHDGFLDCAPTAHAGTDATFECVRDGVAVRLDGSLSSDPDGLPLVYGWTGPFAGGTALGATPVVTFSGLGRHRATLVVSDGYLRSRPDDVEIVLVDTTPPVLVAPADATLECAGHAGTSLALGRPEVSDACDAAPVVTHDAGDHLPLGESVVTWTATDASGNRSTATQIVTVVDTTAPVLTISDLPETLWPPNHKLHRVRLRIVARDACDPEPELSVEVTSNEPDDGLGDGNTTGDIVIHSPSDIELRAERSGPGSGRIYTLVWTARDAAGNVSEETRTVTVPHSKGR